MLRDSRFYLMQKVFLFSCLIEFLRRFHLQLLLFRTSNPTFQNSDKTGLIRFHGQLQPNSSVTDLVFLGNVVTCGGEIHQARELETRQV